MKTVLVMAGGTGGHIFPAYSLANYLANPIGKKSNTPSRKQLISIYGTKLYWMLYWNVDPDPKARVLLVI